MFQRRRFEIETLLLVWFFLNITFLQFTFKITTTDSEDAPLGDAGVRIILQGTDYDESTNTEEDGITKNKDKKFEFGSKVTMTVTKTGYFAKKEEYEFKDSEAAEQEHTIKLTKEGKTFSLTIAKYFLLTFCC